MGSLNNIEIKDELIKLGKRIIIEEQNAGDLIIFLYYCNSKIARLLSESIHNSMLEEINNSY